ncbi:MAG: GNAT family N-acetyltransferase [bacterium]|nr:GNAT family N-acetyltransferase [bacterium]
MAKIVPLKKADVFSAVEINALRKQLSTHAKRVALPILKKMLANKDMEFWVAKDGAHIIGMGAVFFTLKLSGLTGCIEYVVVDGRYRGRGLGKILMSKLIERAHIRRTNTVELTSNPSRITANVMYKKLGFKKRDTNVYRLEL